MMDIMELIKDYGLNFQDRNYTVNSKIEKELESRISAMQEVVDAVIKSRKLGMDEVLFDAIKKYQESIK